MGTTARHRTMCEDCGHWIEEGEPIVPRLHRAWAHEFCPTGEGDALW